MKAIFALCAVLGAGSAVLIAQTTLPPAGSEALVPPAHGTNGPTEIQSQSGQFYMKSNVFIYRGDVHVDNPQMKLTCGLLTIEAPKLPTGKFNRATAETNVVIDFVNGTPPDLTTNHATADKAVYTYSVTNIVTTASGEGGETNSIIVLTGNSVVTNVQGTFKGDPIIMDRIADTITSPNFLKMTVNQSTSNSPSLFDTAEPKKSAPKPTTLPK